MIEAGDLRNTMLSADERRELLDYLRELDPAVTRLWRIGGTWYAERGGKWVPAADIIRDRGVQSLLADDQTR